MTPALVRSLQRLGRGDGLYDEAIKDTPLSQAYDTLGNIIFKPVPAGEYVMVIYLPNRELVIEGLAIE